MLNAFWRWYKDNLFLNQVVVAVLFGWQIFHLFWLTTDVVAARLFGQPFFDPSEAFELFLVIADYFEIPALISGTLLYFHSLKDGSKKKGLTFIILINSQWLHLFWITDEFVVDAFRESGTLLPYWLAWLAISIDYLELPVIYDTVKGVVKKLIANSIQHTAVGG